MTSFLQQQLLRLAAPQTNIYNRVSEKPSLLYEASESRSFTRDAYFKIGLSGYHALLELDPRFGLYEDLFSEKTKDMQRFTVDTASNKLLDKTIESFLLQLSPYYNSLQPALKAMEWLLQRYCINEMNVDAVMMCIMPYYDTPIFVRTLKVLNIDSVGPSGEQNKWQWLSNARKSGVCLVNKILFSRWQSSGAFRMFCNSYLNKILKVHENEKDAIAAINFYVTVVMGGLSHAALRHKSTNVPLVCEDHLNSVLRAMHICLKSRFRELVSGAYLILMQLSISLQINQQVWQQLMALALKTAQPELSEQLSCCLITICQQQHIVHLEPSVVHQLQLPTCTVLQQIAEDKSNKRGTAFLLAYAGGYIKWCADVLDDEAGELQERVLQMVAYVTQFQLQPLQAYAIIRNLMETVSLAALPELGSWLPPVLQQLEQCLPAGYDKAVQYFAKASASPSGQQYEQIHELMDQIAARELTAALSKNQIEISQVEDTSPAGIVRSLLRQLNQLSDLNKSSSEVTDSQQQQPRRRRRLSSVAADDTQARTAAHALLNSCVQSLQLYKLSKSQHLSKSNSEHEGHLPLELLQRVAAACTPLVAVQEQAVTEWHLIEEQFLAQATLHQSSVLLAVKLLHVLLIKPGRTKSLLAKLMQQVGSQNCQLRLLSMVWGWQPYLPQHHLVDSTMKIWCLQKALSLVEVSVSSSGSLHTWMCESGEPFVPSLVSALTITLSEEGSSSQQRKVRRAAAALITALWNTQGVGLRQTNWMGVLGMLAQDLEAVCIDDNSDHLVSLVSRSCGGESGSSLLQSLVSAAALPAQPSHLAAVLLFTLSQLQHKSIFEKLLPVINSILEQIKSSSVTPATEAVPSSKLAAPDAAQPARPGPADGSEAAQVRCLSPGTSMLLYWCLQQLNSASAPLLETTLGWQVFTTAVHCKSDVIILEGQRLSPQAVVAQQVVTHKLVRDVQSSSLSGRMWSVMASAATEIATNHRQVGRLHRALRDVRLHANFVLDQIKQLQLGSKATTIRAAQAKRIKLDQDKGVRKTKKNSGGKKSASKDDHCQTELPSNWRKLKLLLELLCDVKGIEVPWILVEPLCQCMQEALALGMGLAERVVQQILAGLHHLISLSLASPPRDQELRSVLQVNVEMVVQCVRQSSDPYTLRRALLVLALAAQISPDSVLHNLMTIFTFMGEGLLQRDDQFSYQVIETTVSTLVPILVERRSSNSTEVADIAQVFVDALPDIPTHRRLVVFSLLTKALKPEIHLWLVDMLLVKSLILHGCSRMPDELAPSAMDSGARRMPREISFALQLTEQFDAQHQVSAAEHIFSLITAVPGSIGSSHKKNWKPINEYAAVLKLNMLSAKQLRFFIYSSVGFLAQLFSSESFIARLVPVSESRSAADTEQLQQCYESLLTSISSYLTRIAREIADTEQQDVLAFKFWSSLQRKIVELLESVCGLLQPELLLTVTKQLTASPFTAVRMKAIEVLRTRLLPSANFFSVAELPLLKPFVQRLLELGSSSSEPEECRQVALCALQMLLRHLFGHIETDSVLPVMHSAVALITKQDESTLLVIQAILVVAEVVCHLTNNTLFVLPQLVPALLKFLSASQPSPSSAALETMADHLPLSAATALYKLVDIVPQFMSRYVEEIVLLVCRVSWQQQSRFSSRDSKLCNKVSMLATLLNERIQPRVLLPAMLSAHQTLQKAGGEAVCSALAVLELLQELVAHLSYSALTSHRNLLVALLKHALSARHAYDNDPSISSESVERLEDTAVATVLRVVMRQDESGNIILLTTVQSWADELQTLQAAITFYRMVECLAESLQVLFIKSHLADHVFNHSVATLNNLPNIPATKTGKSESRLLHHLLSCLALIFQHDSVGFTSDARFELMIKPIVNQVCNTVGGMTEYKRRVAEDLKPCLLHLCSASRNDALWADLNKEMLMLLRRDLKPEVHASVLMLIESLVSLLREDWLQPLLTDTLPYVTEALESGHAEVEDQARDLLHTMEELMGDAVREQLDV